MIIAIPISIIVVTLIIGAFLFYKWDRSCSLITDLYKAEIEGIKIKNILINDFGFIEDEDDKTLRTMNMFNLVHLDNMDKSKTIHINYDFFPMGEGHPINRFYLYSTYSEDNHNSICYDVVCKCDDFEELKEGLSCFNIN